MLLVVLLAACGSSHDDKHREGSGSGKPVVAVASDAGAGAGSGSAAVTVPLGPDGLPLACGEWKAAIEKLATCAAIPNAARTSLVDVYKEASAGWGQLPADAKKNLGVICQAGADSVLKGAKATCGW